MSITKLLWRFPSVQMAWRNLGRNRIRTALATLGIVIGVIAIASLGMAGAAIHQQAGVDLGDLTNEVTVSPGEDADTSGITDRQVAGLRTVVDDGVVIPQKSDRTTISARSGEETQVSVTGVSQANELYTVSVGEAPARLTSGALLTESTAEQLDLDLGDPVSYNGRQYRIEGLIETTQEFGGTSGDELVVPERALSERSNYDSVTVLLDDGASPTAVTADIEARFNDDGTEQMSVTNFADVQEDVDSFFRTLNLALLGIGSISLVVASVAILNVMLMSTVERRGEIGVLRAVGIRRGEVLRMILAEALFLGVIGGLVGSVVSLAVGIALFALLTDNAWLVFEWESSRYLLYGFGFAVFASLISGLYPAWKAANDRPVEALRE